MREVRKKDLFSFVMVHIPNNDNLTRLTKSIISLTYKNLTVGADMLLKVEVDDYGIDNDLMIFFHTLAVKFKKLVIVHPPPLNVCFNLNYESKKYVYIYFNSYVHVSDDIDSTIYVTEEFVNFVYNTNNWIIKSKVLGAKCLYDSVRLQGAGFKSKMHDINSQLKEFMNTHLNISPSQEEIYPLSPEYNNSTYSVNSPSYLTAAIGLNNSYGSPEYNSSTYSVNSPSYSSFDNFV